MSSVGWWGHKQIGENMKYKTMRWNTIDFGDLLESKCSDLINSRLNKYKYFWSIYVGNIKGSPANIINISPELDRKRRLIAQWNYTILKNIYSIKLLSNKNKKKRSRNIIDIIHQENDFILTTHLFYNNIELIDKIFKQLSSISTTKTPEGFIEFRNFITHNIKPVFEIKSGTLRVPSNLEWFINTSINTNESWIWSDMDFSGVKYQNLSDYINWIFEKSIDSFNKTLEEEINYFKENFNNLRIIDLNSEIIKNIPTYEMSGICTINE